MLAVMSTEVFGIILAGYGSGSKWSLFGGMREAAQMVSYEVPMAICVLVPVIVAGQHESERPSPKQQQAAVELAGVSTIRSRSSPSGPISPAPWPAANGPRSTWPRPRASWWPGSTPNIAASAGWSCSWPSMAACSRSAASPRCCSSAAGAWVWDFETWPTCLGPHVGQRHQRAGVPGQGLVLVFVMMWVRWTLPRLRIDQVMMVCLKYLLPISCALLVGVSLWRVLVWDQCRMFRFGDAGRACGFVALVVKQWFTLASVPPGSAMPGMWRMTT